MKNWKINLLILLLALAMAMTGCKGGSGGGGIADSDNDGISDDQDTQPQDPIVFATFAPHQQLDRLPSGLFSAALGINTNLQVVGISDNGIAQELRGVLWAVAADGTPSAPIELGPLAGNTYSASYGINDAGIAVGESAKGGDTVAVFWPTGSQGAVELLLLASTGPSAAYSVNSSGQIVGEARDAGGKTVAVLWTGVAAAPAALPMLPGGTTSAAYGINADGTKIVGESENAEGKMRAVVWSVAADGTVGSLLELGTLPGHDKSIAMSINANGVIAGESEAPSGETHAVIWTEGAPSGYNIADLGTAGRNSSAAAISDNKLIAGWSEAGGSPLAAAWHAASVTLSNSNNILSGSGFSQAYGINTIGIVVGMAADQGFVAMPAP